MSSCLGCRILDLLLKQFNPKNRIFSEIYTAIFCPAFHILNLTVEKLSVLYVLCSWSSLYSIMCVCIEWDGICAVFLA